MYWGHADVRDYRIDGGGGDSVHCRVERGGGGGGGDANRRLLASLIYERSVHPYVQLQVLKSK